MSHPLLPKLKNNHTIKAPPAGAWDVRPRKSLLDLSQSLAVDKVETDLSSIPDMWARPILFEMALIDPEHTLHRRILGEWRGMLAMLALREVLHLERLTISAVNIPKRDDGPKHPDAAAKDRDFLRTLAKLLPQRSLASSTSWQALHVFLFNGHPFGMTSPTTLVATAADYVNRISSQQVTWYDGAHLQDPVSKLSPAEKRLLADWLVHLKDRIGAHPTLDANRWNSIVALLRNFIGDLQQGIGDVTFSLSQTNFGIPASSILTYLGKPAAHATTAESHVEVIHSAERANAPRLLVFDRTIADQWGVPPQQVTVSGSQSLAATRTPEVPGALVWRAQDFFLDKLVVVNQAGAFPAASLGKASDVLKVSGSAATPILPLNKRLLEHFTGQQLAQSVRWEQVPEGVHVFLSLRVRGMDPQHKNGTIIELSRLYGRDDIRDFENVPILEVWPNLRAPGWKAYFTCYSTDDVANTFEAEPWSAGDVESSTVSMPRELERRRYWLTESFPEAMVCRAGALTRSASPLDVEYAGLLPLHQPPQVQAQNKAYRVGVDFGASSTTICARSGESTKKVELENRKITVTASGGSGQAQLFDFFLPDRRSEMPVLSIFHDFTSTRASELRAFLDGHAYLLETAAFRQDTPGLCFDLKWSLDPVDRGRVRAFLTQLCLQASAELVLEGANEIRWAFSYPTAFDHTRTEGYPGICKQVTDRCADLTGMRKQDSIIMRTESDAAALYFKDKYEAATALGTIFIDIGGSTTDISIWQNRAVSQVSVLLAGRTIFSNFLWMHPNFLSLFRLKEAEQLPALKAQLGDERKPYHARTDAILRYHSDQLEAQLGVNAGQPLVKELQCQLALGIGGLFFYMGLLLRHLMDAGVYRPEVPNIYIGGNGSRILNWLDVDRNGRVDRLYKELFLHAAGWREPKSFQIYKSEDPKTEAARGLVSPRETTNSDERRDVLAGESFVIGTGESSGASAWNSQLTPELLAAGLSAPAKLERLPEFLSLFTRLATDIGLGYKNIPQEHDIEEARRRLGQTLSQSRGMKVDDVVVEPTFIVALRHLLNVLLSR